MDREYERLVAFAALRPDAYERRVVLVALLGYTYLIVAFVVVVGLLVGLGFFLFWWGSLGHTTGWFAFLWIALGGLALRIIHAFTITPPAPSGVGLSRFDAPELLELIDELCISAGAPHFNEVLLVAEAHAGCVQLRRFGLFGATRRYLLIGLTALLAVSPDELRAILAHEIGHLSRQQGRTLAWIYGVRETWVRFLASMREARSLMTGIFDIVFGRYMAGFARYSFVLARQQEINADHFAAALCGSRVTGDALVRLSLVERAIARAANLSFGAVSLDRIGPAARSRTLTASAVDGAQRRRDLNAVLAAGEFYGDPHPALAERLRTLGVDARLVDDPTPSAADRYLGTRIDELCSRIDELWRSTLAKDGARGTTPPDELAAPKADLARLEATPLEDSSREDLRRRAQLTEWLRGSAAALPIYSLLAARDDAFGHLCVGRIRLTSGDDAGLVSLDRVIATDKELAGPAASVAYEFLIEDGRAEDAERYSRIAEQHELDLTARFEARFAIAATDEIAAHDLPEELVLQIGALVERVKPLSRVYLVKKIVEDRPDVRAYFLSIVYGTGWFLRSEQEEVDALTGRLQEGIATLSDEITVVSINRYAGRKHIESVPGALVYARPPESLPRQVLPRWGARAQTLVLVVAALYVLMYVYFVANIRPEFNAIAGPLVLAPLIAILLVLFWSRRDDDDIHRIAGLVGVGALFGMITGAYLTEGEWTLALTPLLALGLLRPPADAPRARAALIVAVSALMGLALRLFAHNVLVG